MRRKIRTFDDVLNALGGVKAVAELTEVTSSAVCKWRSRDGGRFPARTHPRIKAALAGKRQSAPQHLWDFDPPRRYEARAKRVT